MAGPTAVAKQQATFSARMLAPFGREVRKERKVIVYRHGISFLLLPTEARVADPGRGARSPEGKQG
jgi:hypothetical protein